MGGSNNSSSINSRIYIYIYNEITEEYEAPGISGDPAKGQCKNHNGSQVVPWNTDIVECKGILGSISYGVSTATGWSFYNSSGTYKGRLHVTTTYTDYEAAIGVQPSTPIDEEFMDNVLPHLSDADVNAAINVDILEDPVAVPEIAAAAQAIQADQDLLNDADPLNDPVNPDAEVTPEESTAEALEEVKAQNDELLEELQEINESLSVDPNAPTAASIDVNTDLDSMFNDLDSTHKCNSFL